MASIVYRTNKETGTVYAYSSESYRDPVTKKPRNKRTYLGRIDPETQRIVPKAEKGKRNRSKLGSVNLEDKVLPVDVADVIARQRAEIDQLNRTIKELEEETRQTKKALAKIRDAMSMIIDQ